MLDFFFYTLVPIGLAVVYFVGNKFKGAAPFSDDLRGRINKSCYKASFIIIPVAFLIWLGMAYELFDMAGRQSKIGPFIISILLILPVSVCAGSMYLLIALFHRLKSALNKQ